MYQDTATPVGKTIKKLKQFTEMPLFLL